MIKIVWFFLNDLYIKIWEKNSNFKVSNKNNNFFFNTMNYLIIF
jgi:hypothetical protein